MKQKFRSGYDLGAVSTTVIEALPGLDKRGEPNFRAVAVTNWGCGCCKCDDDKESVAMSRRIAASLNLVDTLAARDKIVTLTTARDIADLILAIYKVECETLKVNSWDDEEKDV